MFGIPTFDLLSDRGKQEFIEYMVNLTRKEINSYTPSYNQAGATGSDYVKRVDFDNHVNNTTSVHGISDTANLVYTSDSRLSDTRTPTDASVTSSKFNIDYATAPTVTQDGALYYNTTSDKLFVWDGSAWDEVGAGGVPVGTIVWYAQTTPPVGFLLCDGSSQLRSVYPDLFAIIGTTYGAGSNPGTTFALPTVLSTTGIYVISTQLSPTVYTSDALFTAPIGAMIQWPITSSYPTGWLRSDGTAVSRTTYADLFSVIGTTYGSGDGSTTFNLPNISGSGSGSPVYIIKATLSGTVEPSTVAHASSHIRAGTDVIDGDRLSVDYVPTAYTRNSGATGAGSDTDLTAHLDGLNSALAMTLNQQTASYTLVLTDRNKLVEISNASANNLTVPLNSSVAFPIGTQINILQTGVGQTTIVATGGVTINARIGLKLVGQWSAATLLKRDTNTWVLMGDTTA